MTEMNSYIQEVMGKTDAFNDQVQRKHVHAFSAPQGGVRTRQASGGRQDRGDSSDYIRVTGCGWWRTVIVPPNMFVVHTRRGHQEPLHVGLGISFYFNPRTDSFLVAPSTLQTLLINARCICRERQGILISAYVQYVIEDFAVAYRKLDFSDVNEPMRIVNVQLREQCEASIKDKVATLSIDEVLADKRPIVDELTSRLRSVSDGQGLKIIQVQIKEAVVSSSALWDNLQKPFREEQSRVALLAQLERNRIIQRKEVQDRTEAAIEEGDARLAAEKRAREHEVELARSRAELEDVRVSSELAQIEAQRKLDEAKWIARLEQLKREIEIQAIEHQAQIEREKLSLKLEEERRRVLNTVSPARLEELLIQSLPALVEKMPKPNHQHIIQLSSDGKAGATPDAFQVLGVAGILKTIHSLVPGLAAAAGGGGGQRQSDEGVLVPT